MKSITRFCIRPKGQTEYASIMEVDGHIPNLSKDFPVQIRGCHYWVRFVETIFTEDGYIMQFVALKTNE